MTEQPPAPPQGWAPPDAWAPPYQEWGQPQAPEPAALPPLDEEVRQGLPLGGRWGLVALAQPLIPIGVIALVLIVVLAAGLPTDDTSGSAYSLLAGVLAGGVTWRVGRDLARTYGGWRAAFGFDLPRPRDGLRVLGWFGVQMAARIGVLVVLSALAPSLADSHGGNVEGVSDLGVAALVMAGIGSVVVAPVTEELAFRGILLRGLMRRYSFWPAALMSSTCFAVLHLFGAAHAAGIPLLVSMMLVFGLLQCVLVRRSGRIGPAIGVHATMNLVVLVLAVTSGS